MKLNLISFFKQIFLGISLMAILFTIFSCSPRISRIFVGVADKEFPESLKNSSPDFIRGWKDGCEVGSSGGSNTFYKMFYRSNAIDGFKFSGNTDYRDAWVNAFWYCYRNMYVRHKSSIYSSVFGGYR
jgi:hypothetical protein